MSLSYYESKSLEDLSDYDLYYNFKILEKRLNIAESSKFISFEIKQQMREFYDNYVAELDRRVETGLLTLDDLEEIDEKIDIQLEKEEKGN
jgi:hypothetical protein